MSRSRLVLCATLLVWLVPSAGVAQTSAYRFTFPDPEIRWMQVDLTLAEVPPGQPLELHVSRSSPGRYAAHDFVKGMTNLEVTDDRGARLEVAQPTPAEWRIERPTARVHVRYRLAGDRTDGTYVSINPSHAHINMPAALIWARGFEETAIAVRFDPPSGSGWKIATQLFPGEGEQDFTAPNLQYLMDSPTELSALTLRSAEVVAGGRSTAIRLAVHHDGTADEVDSLAGDAARIAAAASRVFGELPVFDVGAYTFLADYRSSVNADGMEHRNSSVVTWPGSIRSSRNELLAALSHEFFHVWNVERIRPQSLEPFNFDEVNRSGELWLAEGFTEYYGSLILARAELITPAAFAAEIGTMVQTVLASPARRVRTLEEMSRLATIVDGGPPADVAGLRATYLSYYTWGGAVALALDLTLRDRTDGQVTLDTFMRTLWERHGRPPGPAPGVVARPYTVDDLEAALAITAGDSAFAAEFFSRFIQGHDVADYDRLLAKAGFVWGNVGRDRQILRLGEESGAELTAAQRRFRAAWLTFAGG